MDLQADKLFDMIGSGWTSDESGESDESSCEYTYSTSAGGLTTTLRGYIEWLMPVSFIDYEKTSESNSEEDPDADDEETS